jgi:plasmid stabilization system protein ParE
LAERELNEAAQYYDSENPGLGAAFVNEVQRCIRDILEHPEAGPVLAAAVRRRLIRRFPYAVLYSIKPTGVRILAVTNLRRRPMYWVGRE